MRPEPIPEGTRYKARDIEHGYLSVLIDVFGQVDVSATGRLLVQRSPTDCVCVCVINP